MSDKLEIPNLSRSTGLVMVRGVYYARYYKNNIELRRSLSTANEATAKTAQALFYKNLKKDGATVFTGRSTQDKLKDKPDLYIYTRKPILVQIKGKVIGEFMTKKEARVERDKYLATL